MESNRAKKVLDAYMSANNMKDIIIYKDSKESVAANKYGAIILAMAINSEFNLTDDIAKVIRLISLSGVDLSSLDNANNYLDEQKNFKEDMIIKESNIEETLASNCIFLDQTISRQIFLNGEEGLEDYFIKLLPLGTDKSSLREISKFYLHNYKLKHLDRSGWDKKHWDVQTDRVESIADHVIGTIVLAMVMNIEYQSDIDINKVVTTLALHEIGESVIGDITPFDGTDKLLMKAEIETIAMGEVLGNLKMRKTMMKYLNDFQFQKSKEAKFAHLCDKIEADLQAKVYQDNGMQKSLADQKGNVVYNSDKLRELINNGAQTVFNIWYEYDKGLYSKNDNFKELLEEANRTNLVKVRKL